MDLSFDQFAQQWRARIESYGILLRQLKREVYIAHTGPIFVPPYNACYWSNNLELIGSSRNLRLLNG
jgi:hypothetical protein